MLAAKALLHLTTLRNVSTPKIGMFDLILAVLNRDYTRGYYNPYEGLLVQAGTSLHPKPEPPNPKPYPPPPPQP